MSYNRKIFYLSFYEGDEKRGNAGYIKVLEKGDILEADLRLSGMSPIYDGGKELEISQDRATISTKKIFLKNGQGMGKCSWEKTGHLAQLSFRVQLTSDCYLDTWERNKQELENHMQTSPHPEGLTEAILPMQDVVWPQKEYSEIIEEVGVQEKVEKEQVLPQLEISETKEEPILQKPQKKEEVKERVENRKWKQIYKTYPHIKPFGDFREYIKLDLKDMVLISEKRYSLVENSFLLHGYYNYGHIILWKKEKTPVKYYIGVPGNFYEKEKQVAVLYGFENFEGAVEPAREGDFGYYMTEVSI